MENGPVSVQKMVSVVCNHPPGLFDEPAKPGNVTSLARSSQFSLAASSSLSPRATALSEQAKASSTLQEGFLEYNHERPRVPIAAVLDETMRFSVKATGKDDVDAATALEHEDSGLAAKSRPLENTLGGKATLSGQGGGAGDLQEATKLHTENEG